MIHKGPSTASLDIIAYHMLITLNRQYIAAVLMSVLSVGRAILLCRCRAEKREACVVGLIGPECDLKGKIVLVLFGMRDEGVDRSQSTPE